ncbi:hypothetical protein [Candidatus Accumulibacter sp. ACC007]|uniref:hypothetical protein n=1 Tax=Candidatus Accumulibacter sp. ACC007 TaxID=2823333 RepID=UPI0025BBD681|nr:hypothetical protein [Candidatus Accumulibacter sp. ACC007]
MKKAVQKAAAPEASSTATKASTGKPSTTKATTEPPLRILKIARCPTVSGKSTLTYHVGCTPESAIKIRLYGNTGNGFLNQDWIAWTAIQEKLELHSPFTSQVLHALFSGKSLNSPGFLMAVLRAEGVVKSSTVKGRCYELTKDSGFLAEIERLMASSVDLDADTEGREEAKTAAKSKPRKQAGEAEATTEAPTDVDTGT